MSRDRNPRKSPPLKFFLRGMVLGILAFPVLVSVIVSACLQKSAGVFPDYRFISVRPELQRAIVVRDGIKPRPGYVPPDWLDLVVADADGRVLLSTLGGIPAGSEFGAAARLNLAALAVPGVDVYMERLGRGDKFIGSYAALVRQGRLGSNLEVRIRLFQMSMLGGIIAFAMMVVAAIATYLGRSIARLERAASGIAAGDLSTAVDVRGVREIVNLSSALNGMRERLREDQAQRSRFLAAISHDLRTPLTSLRGYLEAMDDGLAEEPAVRARYMETAQDKCRVLEGRIDELLEFARMETAEWRMRFQSMDLANFLKKLAEDYGGEARAAGKRFVAALDDLPAVIVEADERLLIRAFENLFTNALRYAPADGEIRLSAHLAQGVVLIDLEDEGPGIPEEELTRVFEPYFRGSSSSSWIGEGLGLGLFIARSILRGHGWDLTASRRTEGGSRFSVRAPVPPSQGQNV